MLVWAIVSAAPRTPIIRASTHLCKQLWTTTDPQEALDIQNFIIARQTILFPYAHS